MPYFEGCERLRYDLFRGCALEVCDVEDYASFKKMAGAGVSRVVTSSISEIYERWVEDLEKECEVQGLLKEETPVQGLVKKETSTEEVNCKMQTFK